MKITINRASANIKALDAQISDQMEKLNTTTDNGRRMAIKDELESLIEYRTKLCDSKNKDSIKVPVITGLFSVATVLIVLYYEKTDVITSKAFSIATRFGGR